MKPRAPKAKRASKLNLWLKHYLNECNPVTFMNKTESSRAAGYNCRTENAEDCLCQIGCQNFVKLKIQINKWFDEVGLSEEALQQKLMELMSVKEKKFFSAPVKDSEGIVVGMHIEDIDVPAIETQRKTLDMALKVKGMMKPVVHEVAGKKGGKIGIEHSADNSWKDLLSSVTCDNDDKLPNKD